MSSPHRTGGRPVRERGGVEWSTVAMLPACPPTVAPRRETDCERERGRISGGSCCIVKPQAPQPHLANSNPCIDSDQQRHKKAHCAAPPANPRSTGTREREMNADFGAPKDLAGGLQQRRSLYQPTLPPCLQGATVKVEYGDATTTIDPTCANVVAQAFPRTYGQPLSPGGHNVIWGLHDALKAYNPHSVLYGFVGGTEGLFANKTIEITDDVLASYKNQGGFDLLGRSIDQIRSTKQVNAAMTTCNNLNLDGLVIIGGVTSNSDAAQLAEALVQNNCKTKVVGVPVSLNGDLKNQFVETTVGFDTVCKLVSNVCLDAISAGKYYYFVRLMGRKASHVAFECALQSHPNMLILAEEVALSKLTLMEVINKICDGVQARAELGKFHGVLLIPEGLIESIPEMYALLQEINILHNNNVPVAEMPSQLSPWAAALFQFLPPFIRRELLLHQESDNSAQLSQIDTEQLLAHLVEAEMIKRTKEGRYKGRKFSSVCHFFGYQARGSVPSNFDCDYAYALGRISLHMIAAGLTGYMATVANLKDPVDKWRCAAAPLTAMMSVKRHLRGPGAIPIGKPAIHPSPIDLKGKAYELLREKASSFLLDDFYRTPGGIQYEGPGCNAKPITLTIENQDYMGDIEILKDCLSKVRTMVKPGCSREVLKAAISSMLSVTDVLTVMSHPLNAELPLYHFN
uniref:Pyrophosphate--fructose 6-phosphate 1-phosphotransferase subunit alpha n=1 Tax=Oryza rufipogon TaxID=4529 RepID=A0A0E0QHR6_ORYRU